MRLLILTSSIGKTAPGIVFERLIYGLSRLHAVDVITSDFGPTLDLSGVRRVSRIRIPYVPGRIKKAFISLLALNPFDLLWSGRVLARLKDTKDYDVIIGFVSFNHYAPLVASRRIAKKLNVKHFVYCVDAIPAPAGWIKNDLFYKGTRRFISSYLSKADGFFSANRKMLDYQLTTFIAKKGLVADVIYNPSPLGTREYELVPGRIAFLYTGSLYGPRTPKALFNAFKKFLQDYPNSTLEFVGSKISADSLLQFTADELDRIIIHPFADDLDAFYERATALIDINSDIVNDVFLSSKLINYVSVNRIIICISASGSPARELFSNIRSIVHCSHDAEEIAKAMSFAVQESERVTFGDRADVRSILSITEVTRMLNKWIYAHH